MAACSLATAIVLTTFRLGKSGTRHAMLVTYYNGGGPSGTIVPMLGYMWNAVWECRKKGKWAVDWDAFWASSGLLFLAVALLTGDTITKFFWGGQKLIVANVAQVNPNAVFYPHFNSSFQNGMPNIPEEVVQAYKTIIPQAVYQASARKTNAQDVLQKRIQFGSKSFEVVNGAGVQFEYQYNLTGFEMGLRDAPGLIYSVRGSCATYHGSDTIIYSKVFNLTTGYLIPEESERYMYFGGTEWGETIMLDRENNTAPWARFVTQLTDEYQDQRELSGVSKFMIVPHTAWRLSKAQNPNRDPWYETEANPAHVDIPDPGLAFYYPPYRVKRARPPLQCTQNDTYTYQGHTVNHVSKLKNLPGLKLSPFIMSSVFALEFGEPVFSKLLNNLFFGALASNAFFDPNLRMLDTSRVSLYDDFKGLVDMSFVYSREVVRNTVLLYPSLQGANDRNFNNSAKNGDPAKNADFFLEGTAVAAMSVYVMIVTPCVCVLLWILVFWWGTKFYPESALDNKSYKARHTLRLHGFQAVHLFRYLDEELSQKRKWSGRNTQTPFIRDLDADQDDAGQDETVTLPVSVAPVQLSKTPTTTESRAERTSQYAKPKVLPVQGPPEPPGLLEKILNAVQSWFRRPRPESERPQFEVTVTRVWDPEIAPAKWKHIRRNI